MEDKECPQIISGDERLIGLRKAAQWLDTSLRTVQRLVAAGELPQPIRIGKSSKLEIHDVRTYIERQKQRYRPTQKEKE